MTTVADGMRRAKALGVDRLDAQLLLAHLLAQARSWLVAHDDAVIDSAQWRTYEDALTRRVAGEPLAYLVGAKEFHGLELRLDANVLVPRPETELLVDWALELLAGALQRVGKPRVVDLGTGSGAIALAIKRAHPVAMMLATDISDAALAVARRNAERLALDVAHSAGDWWPAVEGRRFDLALSNPPYIAASDPHLVALHHEPALALTPGGDGLDALRRIVNGAPAHLEPGAWLLLEHGYDQAEAVQVLLRAQGFTSIETRLDLGGQPRCSGGRRPEF